MRAKYDDEIVKAMTEKFGYTNVMQVPKITKITLNMGVGEASQDKKKVQTAAEEMELIAGPEAGNYQGQEVDRPVQAARRHADRLQGHAASRTHVRISRPSRDGRDCLASAISVVSIPGRSTVRGNYAMGLKEQIIFPEISYDRIDKVRGMDIIVTTTAATDDEARELLRLFGFPFPAEEAEQQEAA